jgi:hypothetical protein
VELPHRDFDIVVEEKTTDRFADNVSDEVIGFHCQQAAEKMLKADAG